MSNDLINGLFELMGGALLLLNVRRVLRDKTVAGVSWLPVFFFTAWGVWNLYYYPSLGQWYSFAGGLLIVIVNTVWLALVIKYKRAEQKRRLAFADLARIYNRSSYR